jgi:surfeit locus 1 family protein
MTVGMVLFPRTAARQPAYRRVLLPGLSTLAMLIVLVALGTWQVYRLHWKEAILAQIATAEAAPAVSLAVNAPPAAYTKIAVTGRFLFDRVAQFGAEVRDTRAGPTIGSYQIVPLERDNASTILVNRGWIPQKRASPLDDPDGVVTVTGYVRPGEKPSWFSATDAPAERQFYTLDPEVIGARLGVPKPAPFTLVAMGPSIAEIYPTPAEHLPRPPNNHLSYVITWYGLAAALVVIFITWARKALRS